MVDAPGPTPTLPMQHGKAFLTKIDLSFEEKLGAQFETFVVVVEILFPCCMGITFSIFYFSKNLMLFHHFQLFLQTHSEDAYCSTPNPPKSTTTKISSFVTSTFPPERCRKSEVWPSPAEWQALFFLLPMQHGKAKTHFCDTSQAGRCFCSFL